MCLYLCVCGNSLKFSCVVVAFFPLSSVSVVLMRLFLINSHFSPPFSPPAKDIDIIKHRCENFVLTHLKMCIVRAVYLVLKETIKIILVGWILFYLILPSLGIALSLLLLLLLYLNF